MSELSTFELGHAELASQEGAENPSVAPVPVGSPVLVKA